MNGAEKPPTDNRRFRYERLLNGGIVVFVCMVVLFVPWRLQVSLKVGDEMGRLRAGGQPTTSEELADYYKPPSEDQDATQLWLEGMRLFNNSEFRERLYDLPSSARLSTRPVSDQVAPDLAEFQAFVSDYRNALDKLHAAALKGGRARYSVQFQNGWAAKLPHVDYLRSAAELLRMEAHVLASDGNVNGVVESIHAIFMVARSLENEPVLVSQLNRNWIHSKASGVIEELLPRVRFTDEDLISLQADLRSPDWHDALRRGLAGDCTCNILGIRSSDSQGIVERRFGRVLSNDDLLLTLQLFERLIDATGMSWPEALDRASQVETQLTQAVDGTLFGRDRYPFTMKTISDNRGAFEQFARTEISSNVVDTAIAVELFHRKHKRLPAMLDDLVPDFLPQTPVDSLDRRPLQMVVREDAYVVYSLRAVGVDKSGELELDAKGPLTFTVQRRATP